MEIAKIKFKEIELLVFALKPELTLTQFYINTRNSAEAIGYINFLKDQRNSNNFYIYAKITLKIGFKEVTVCISKKNSIKEEKEVLFKAKKEYCLETLFEKIEKFNKKKLWSNSKKMLEQMEFQSNIYI